MKAPESAFSEEVSVDLDSALVAAVLTSTLPEVAEAISDPRAETLLVRYFEWRHGDDLESFRTENDEKLFDSRRCGLARIGSLDLVVSFSPRTSAEAVEEVLVGEGASAIASTLDGLTSAAATCEVEPTVLLFTAANVGLVSWIEQSPRGTFYWPCNPSRLGLDRARALTVEEIASILRARLEE